MWRRSDNLKANLCRAQQRSQNCRSAIASADSFDRYYRLSDYRFLHYRPKPRSNHNLLCLEHSCLTNSINPTLQAWFHAVCSHPTVTSISTAVRTVWKAPNYCTRSEWCPRGQGQASRIKRLVDYSHPTVTRFSTAIRTVWKAPTCILSA